MMQAALLLTEGLRDMNMQTTAAPPKKEKVPRELDPRNPNFRLEALLDYGSVELITDDDDSGMLAAVGQVDGTRVVAFCSDATVMGGAMGDLGCRVVVDASVGYTFRSENALNGFGISLNVTNLTDKKYVSTIGSNGFTASGDNQTLLAGAPRQWFVTLKKGF